MLFEAAFAFGKVCKTMTFLGARLVISEFFSDLLLSVNFLYCEFVGLHVTLEAIIGNPS